MWVKVPIIDYGWPGVIFTVSSRQLQIEQPGLMTFPFSVLEDESKRGEMVELWFNSVISKIWPEYSGGSLISFGNHYTAMLISFMYTHKNLPRNLVGDRPKEWLLLDKCVECRSPIDSNGEYTIIAVNLPATIYTKEIKTQAKLCSKCAKKIEDMKGVKHGS